ncbi:hypothetical protein ACHJH3_06900 [Campylobacter sp. MOP7]|uniref:hypothetical protein n=1 Tax=Campylobacter canis TaxID=3378588 RepID=UPI00387EB2EC
MKTIQISHISSLHKYKASVLDVFGISHELILALPYEISNMIDSVDLLNEMVKLTNCIRFQIKRQHTKQDIKVIFVSLYDKSVWLSIDFTLRRDSDLDKDRLKSLLGYTKSENAIFDKEIIRDLLKQLLVV